MTCLSADLWNLFHLLYCLLEEVGESGLWLVPQQWVDLLLKLLQLLIILDESVQKQMKRRRRRRREKRERRKREKAFT